MWIAENVKQEFSRVQQELTKRILDSGVQFESIGLFGSYARGEFKATSDVDMCVIVKEMPDRRVKGWLLDDAEELGADLVFVLKDVFENSTTKFMLNLKRDYKEVLSSNGQK